MNPYTYLSDSVKQGNRVLSLCCGIGLELKKLKTSDIVAVDIVPEYLEEVKKNSPAKTVCSDVLEYVKKQPNNSFDIISIIDGIEHLDKSRGLKLVDEMKRVAKDKILLFTPDGYVLNKPQNVWGTDKGDKFQEHLSGWELSELKGLGFELVERVGNISQHGQRYNALMMEYKCSQS